MIGGEAIAHTLAGSGLSVCFANPGTSELHLVAGLDTDPRLRGVLCLFEGVATGACDGYGRMTGRPAAALLHLGPGLANGLANLHNARRARTPLVTLVGDHATYHKRYDAPLESDIEALAGAVSGWLRRSASPADAPADAADAVAAALRPPGQVATLILPADVTWSDGADPAPPVEGRGPAPVRDEAIGQVATVLRDGEPAVLLLGGTGVRRAGLEAASRVAAATGVRLVAETFPARLERGAGLPAMDRLAYLPEFATAQLAGARHLVLAGAAPPATFFAYQGKPSSLVPAGCQLHLLAEPGDDVPGALAALADLVAAAQKPAAQPSARPALPEGDLTAESAAAVIGALLPADAIVCDEANTSGLWLAAATAGAPPHDWLTLTGGAIGQGLPLAAGAAVGCPGRPVLALEADGSAMYTASALWTHAREQLDVTTVIFSNRSYAILNMEMQRTGAAAMLASAAPCRPGQTQDPVAGTPVGARDTARGLLELSRPDIDFTALAAGMGVPASRARTATDFAVQLRVALAEPGPHLIEAVVPPVG
jgi:acetolactate synthase I/II/III large subunit